MRMLLRKSGAPQMHQPNLSVTNLMNDPPVAPGAHLAAADVPQTAEEATLVSFGRLHGAVAELFRALSETLADQRSSAEECLRRAGAMLAAEAMERQAPLAVPRTARRGLAPWQVRRVMAYIDANLDKPIRNKDLAELARQ